MLFLIALASLLYPVYAKLVAIEPTINTTIFIIMVGSILIFALFVAIEFVIVYLFLRHIVRKKIELFKVVLLINLIVFPITQILALVLLQMTFKGYFFQNFHYFAEFFPFIAEFFLFRWQFAHLFKEKVLKKQIKDDMVLVITLAANAVTFFLGVIILSLLSVIGFI